MNFANLKLDVNLNTFEWNNVWKNSSNKNNYGFYKWRDERADDKIGYFIQQGIKFKKNDKVLDAGCGDGSILFSLKQNFNTDIYGIDFSEKAIELAQNKQKKLNTEIILKKSNVTSMPFLNDFFDKIFSLGVVEHLYDQQIAINEAARCLKNNGIFILMTPNKNSFGRIERIIRVAVKCWPFGYQTEFTTSELEEMVNKSGLRVIKSNVLLRKRMENDNLSFKLIRLIDHIFHAFNKNWGFYSYVFATKGEVYE